MNNINLSSDLLMNSGLTEQQKTLTSQNNNALLEGSFYQELMNTNSSDKIATNNENLIQGIQQLSHFLEVKDASFLTELTQAFFKLANVSIQFTETESLQSELSQDSLVLWVPLTSVAIGRLEQTQTNILALFSEAQQPTSILSNIQVNANKTNVIASHYSLEINQQTDKKHTQNSTYTNPDLLQQIQSAKQSELQRLNSSQYASLASQNNADWLTKKLTFLKNSDGITLLYRDYKENTLNIEKQLLEMKKFLENKLVIKQVVFNGKTLFSSNQKMQGETDAS